MSIDVTPPANVEAGNYKISVAFQIINRYVRFVDRDNAKPRSDWRINEEWAWFMGEHKGSLKLTTKPEPYSFERTLHWLSHQVDVYKRQVGN